MSTEINKIPLKGGDEQDALTSWKNLYVYLGRAGVRKKIKRKYNRRRRHESKRSLIDRSRYEE